MTEFACQSKDRSSIEETVLWNFGLTLSRWMLDLAATARGRAGRLPIDAQAIAILLGVQFDEAVESGTAGSATVTPDGATISIADDIHGAERNFTIAHELGHVLLHRASDGEWIDGQDVEHLCDMFAAYLLAPVTFVDGHLREHGATMGSVTTLAETCAIPVRGLAALLTEHYPLSLWWRHREVLHGVGRFDVSVFEEEINGLLAAEGSRTRIHFEVNGIREWVIEAARDTSGSFGLVKPTGTAVRDAPAVRAINEPRRRLFEAESGDWTLAIPRSTQPALTDGRRH